MKNNLERFIRDNREDFDADEPSLDLWARIESGITIPDSSTNQDHAGPAKAGLLADLMTEPVQTPHNGRPFGAVQRGGWQNTLGFNRWMAASVAVLLLVGSFWLLNYRYGVAEQPEVVAVSPTYAKEFVQYTRLVDAKREELKSMTASNPSLYEAFASDLSRLERNYQNLKADLPATPNQEVLVQAMIQNLQLQIDLLNEQLRVIQRMKGQNNKTNENLI
ncbi:hypothetical protein F5984_26135 [Rudanella paleaurantiibacter]|uniref:Anti-sigma factor n=1 Tax=Rudanella paleaurantiibacter TaxID=2614655 RepID=A0A7J5TRW4_9BACT|nr:hypothetical protein [Rudanella paleaurantiibacter]KAB7725399.1 hypothetical protein F5984_26135 [Rudanella paleaurantiibacter]